MRGAWRPHARLNPRAPAFTTHSGSWVLLYTIEAVAILSVLNRYPNDAKEAVRVAFLCVRTGVLGGALMVARARRGGVVCR